MVVIIAIIFVTLRHEYKMMDFHVFSTLRCATVHYLNLRLKLYSDLMNLPTNLKMAPVKYLDNLRCETFLLRRKRKKFTCSHAHFFQVTFSAILIGVFWFFKLSIFFSGDWFASLNRKMMKVQLWDMFIHSLCLSFYLLNLFFDNNSQKSPTLQLYE